MSRAFTKESDDAFEDPPERDVSLAPNLVTARGLAAIEEEVARLNAELIDASADDRYLRPRIARDLRYWSARHASARLTHTPERTDIVQFGSTITIYREDGRQERFQIVGEDEADPKEGTIAYTSPIARAFMGKPAGASERVNGAEIELVSIE